MLITMILARWCVKSQRWKGNGGRGSASDQYWDYCSPQVMIMMTVIREPFKNYLADFFR